MQKTANYDDANSVDRNVAIQMITFSIVIIVVIITLVSFIQIYSSKREQILKDLEMESIHWNLVLLDIYQKNQKMVKV